MASPFYLFRKYQKAFLVVAGVLAMFIFVVADPLMSWLQSSGGGGQRSANTVVATWDGGSLNIQQLKYLAQRRLKISDFLRGLYIKAATMVEQEGGTPLPPTLPNFIIENNNFDAIQVNCVSTRVLAELAEKSGISVSDDVVNHYLSEWGLRRMGDVEIGNLMGRVGLNDKTLFAGLRELLMGNFYINSYSLAMRGVLPQERWQDWKHINERIAIEAAVLPAEKFLADVPKPSEAELQQFYELHKDRIAGTFQGGAGTNPGFREPRRVKLQYLLGSVADWTQKLSDTVTDAEIADYYERNKRSQFIKTSTSTSADGLFDADETDADETDDSESDDSKTDDSESVREESEGESSDSESAEEEPATESEETTEPAAETPAEDESGRAPRKSPFRLVVLQEDTEAAEGETASEAETDGETEKSEEATESVESEAEAEYEPLENVREQIRRTLAQDKAVVEMQKVVERTYARLQSAYNPYGFKVVSARSEEKEIPAPPVELSDFKSLATEMSLASEETVLLSQQALAETFVGRAFDTQTRSELVHQGMFSDQELYEPYRASDLDGNAYLVAKTEDVPSRVPEYQEVREAVLAAWKKQEAAKLALAKAEELVKQAETSNDPVATIASGQGYETVTTDMFSWLTFGTTQAEMQRGPRLGEAPPLEAIGSEFMTQAFALQPGQKIALLNYDHSNAYVVQLDRREQTEDEMRQQFLAEANNWYGGRVMNAVRGNASQRQLFSQLSEQAGLNLDKLEEMLSKESQ